MSGHQAGGAGYCRFADGAGIKLGHHEGIFGKKRLDPLFLY